MYWPGHSLPEDNGLMNNPYRTPNVPKHLEIFHPWFRRDLPVELLERLYQDCVVQGYGVALENTQGYITIITISYQRPEQNELISVEICFDLGEPGYVFIWNLNRGEQDPEAFDPERFMALIRGATPRRVTHINLSEEDA